MPVAPMKVVSELRALLGDDAVLDADDVAQRSAGLFRGDHLKACALVRPSTTDAVSLALSWCHANGVSVVPQGGLTGLVHGADAEPDQVILSLERMAEIESIDPLQRIAVVQAGVVLQTLQEAVADSGLMFPLDLGARGSATIGGNAATNAGGNRVIRYGMMRDMVLGLEVVLADGTVVTSMNTLLKNNTGYDLKQLFIGSEGTLGVITRLVLRLREKQVSTNVALAAAPSFEALTGLLKHMDQSLGGSLSAFEVMWRSFYQLVTTPPARSKPPLPQDYPFYALIESLGSDHAADAARFHAALESALEANLIVDAAVAQSEADAKAIWSLRDDVLQVAIGGIPIVFDVSLPVARMEDFVNDLAASLPTAIGEHKYWVYGHMGDGNLHINVQVQPQNHAAQRPVIEALVYGKVRDCNGSISAEHGIGTEKKAWLAATRNPAEIALMQQLKAALDPRGVLNPGKVI